MKKQLKNLPQFINDNSTYLEVLGDFANQTLEWQLANQQFSALLVLADLTAHQTSLVRKLFNELGINTNHANYLGLTHGR